MPNSPFFSFLTESNIFMKAEPIIVSFIVFLGREGESWVVGGGWALQTIYLKMFMKKEISFLLSYWFRITLPFPHLLYPTPHHLYHPPHLYPPLTSTLPLNYSVPSPSPPFIDCFPSSTKIDCYGQYAYSQVNFQV